MRARLGLLSAIGAGLVLGCVGVGDLIISGAGGAGHDGGTVAADAGLPCDVVTALSLCVNCHSDPPVGDAIGSLYTYADLMAPAPTDPSKTMAEMAVVRMQDTATPMPPAQLGQPATTTQIQAIMGWLAAGSPTGTCGPPPDTTFAGDPVCASGNFYQRDGGAGPSPGLPCPECAPADAGVLAPLAGTVFAAGKVLDGCLPPASVDMTKASVRVKDGNGLEYMIPVGPDGNFRSDPSQKIVFPFTAQVTYMGKTRAMLWRQWTGDCNSCHTAAGANAAPGRITLPN
jgi:hypothetical protein